MIATKDAGKSWHTLVFNDSCAACDAKTSNWVYAGAGTLGSFRTLGNLNITLGTKSNVSGRVSLGSTQYSVGSNGEFTRTLIPGNVSILNLPNLRMFGPGSGDYLRLNDGSLLGIAKSVLASGSGRLSCVAYRSTDGGVHWTFASVVANTSEVPYAAEGPSEGALAILNNGTLMAVMRVEGQSGHYSPYISKLSEDGGLTWHSLRSLHGGGSGGVPGAGCVRPRLLQVGSSLLLSGGRPNPVSRDVLVWWNAAGDGEEWEAHSISYEHNKRIANSSWVFPPAATNNSRSFPRLTTSYTSLIRTGNTSGYIVYGLGIRSFAMPFVSLQETPTTSRRSKKIEPLPTRNPEADSALASSLIAPGSAFDFTSKWQLQTCWDAPRVVQGAALQTYASPHFFLETAPNATCGNATGIVFVTPDNASAHTTHADHPRTELRDISTPDWAWPSPGATATATATAIETTVASHRLRAMLVVDHVASGAKPWTIIAQIHGSIDEERAKVIKLRWTGGLVEARVKNATAPFVEIGLPLGRYALGDVLQVFKHTYSTLQCTCTCTST